MITPVVVNHIQSVHIWSHVLSHLLLLSYATVGWSESPTKWVTTGCPEAFKSRCLCGQKPYPPTGRLTFITNCTNTNFTNTDMLTQLSPETEVLIFTGNNIQSLPPNLIGQDVTYDKLHTIDLSNNTIRYIQGKSFHRVGSVRVLNLNHNEILIDEDNFHPRIFSNFRSLEELHLKNAFDSAVHDSSFLTKLWQTFNESSITTLKVLDLDDNRIRSTFPSQHMLCPLPALQRLHLSGNFLTDFTLNLTCLKSLALVDISYNFITTLSNRSIAAIETGPPNYHMNISNNSYKCDCNLIDFFQFTKMPDKTIILDSVEKYRCFYGHPMDNAGKYFDDLSVLDLECINSIQNDDFKEYISISYTILTALLLVLSGLLVALIYINKQYLINGWTYLTTGLISKREYTSLEKESKRHNQTNQEVAEVEV